jgi:arginine repressor
MHSGVTGRIIMRKTTEERREKIKAILAKYIVFDQEYLQWHLQAAGIEVSQPTLSRDLKALRAVRTYTDTGRRCYYIPGDNHA